MSEMVELPLTSIRGTIASPTKLLSQIMACTRIELRSDPRVVSGSSARSATHLRLKATLRTALKHRLNACRFYCELLITPFSSGNLVLAVVRRQKRIKSMCP